MATTPRTIRLNELLEANLNKAKLEDKQFNFNEYVNSLIEKDLMKDDIAVAKQATVLQEFNPNDLLKRIARMETMFEAFSDEILNYKDLQKETLTQVEEAKYLILESNIKTIEGLNEVIKFETKSINAIGRIFDINNQKLDSMGAVILELITVK